MAPSRSASTARLAAALLGKARAAFRVLAPAARAAPLAAIDRFLAAPTAATFAAASRALLEARRHRCLARMQAGRAERAFARGLESVGRELGADAAAALAALPTDERAGQRLHALALLTAAHRELAERVAGQADAMRRQLAYSPEPSPSPRPTTSRAPRPRKRTGNPRRVRER